MTKDIKELIWLLFEMFCFVLTSFLIAVVVMVAIFWGLPMIGVESSCK